MLLKDQSSSAGMDYIEMKRRGNFTRRILFVCVVFALLIYMLRRPSSVSGSTKVYIIGLICFCFVCMIEKNRLCLLFLNVSLVFYARGRRDTCPSDGRCRLHRLPCCSSPSERFVPCDYCGTFQSKSACCVSFLQILCEYVTFSRLDLSLGQSFSRKHGGR